jgi:hypothetical protein
MIRRERTEAGLYRPRREILLPRPRLCDTVQSGLMMGGGGVAPGGDPYWDNVVLYLRGNGVDNGTVVYDEVSQSNLTRHTSVTTATDIKRFGSAAIKFTSSSVNYPVTLPGGDGLLLNGDFTIEFWVYQTANQSNTTYLGSNYSPGGINHQFQPDCGSGGSYRFGMWNAGWKTATAAQAIGLNAWHAIAITRSGSILRFYYDGIKIGSDVTGATASYDFRNGALGALGGYGATAFVGRMDEVRITKSVARYIGDSYTLQAEEFLNY